MMAPWKVDPGPQVLAKLCCEKKAIEKLLPSKLEEFAVHPRRIAFLTVNRQIKKRLMWFPKLRSYRRKDCGDEFRFMDSYGWRLIIKIDRENHIVHALYLSRIEDRHTSPAKTLDEFGVWRERHPEGDSH